MTGFLGRIALALLLLAGAPLGHATQLGPDGVPGERHPGKFIWFDLATEDPDRARAFYGAVFGWRFGQVAGTPASYTVIEDSNGKVGGLFRQARPAGAPVGARWLALMSVRDAAESARYVREHGGEVLIAPRNVEGRGTHALFRDPQGAVFGVLAASGGDPSDAPAVDGDMFWLDLFAHDAVRASSFYAGLGGYEVNPAPAPGGRTRLLLATEGIARAGIVEPRGTTPAPGWLPYVLVEDVPQTLQKVRAAGGKVVVEPRSDLLDGKLAVIADPSGGVIGVIDWEVRVDAQPRQ
jgi:predicted enzyme related to lactoylglutathione lyase